MNDHQSVNKQEPMMSMHNQRTYASSYHDMNKHSNMIPTMYKYQTSADREREKQAIYDFFYRRMQETKLCDMVRKTNLNDS